MPAGKPAADPGLGAGGPGAAVVAASGWLSTKHPDQIRHGLHVGASRLLGVRKILQAKRAHSPGADPEWSAVLA